MKEFDFRELRSLYKPQQNSGGEDNGQITIIGGSKLFHGAPLFALKTASRIVDMVFFASPDPSVGRVAERIRSELLSFIWVPWEDVESYIEKSDAALIGPGLMRFGSEKTREEERNYENNVEGKVTREITKVLLQKYPKNKWVIDGGSLQVMDPEWIPERSVLTPNRHEFKSLFGSQPTPELVKSFASKYRCVITAKGPETIVSDGSEMIIINGGNPGMTKGGTGDVLAGLTVALLAKNEPLLSACAASYIEKAAADDLFEKVDVNYNADDLAKQLPETFFRLLRQSEK